MADMSPMSDNGSPICNAPMVPKPVDYGFYSVHHFLDMWASIFFYFILLFELYECYKLLLYVR